MIQNATTIGSSLADNSFFFVADPTAGFLWYDTKYFRANYLWQPSNLMGTRWTRQDIASYDSATGLLSNVIAGPNLGYVRQNLPTIADNTQLTFSADLEAVNGSWGYLYYRNKANVNAWAYFNLTTGALGTTSGTGNTPTITAVEGGKWRCTIGGSLGTGGTAPFVQVQIATGDNSTTKTAGVAAEVKVTNLALYNHT